MTVNLVKKDPDIAIPNVEHAIKEHQKCQILLSQGYKLEAIHKYTYKDGKPHYFKIRFKLPNTKKKECLSVHFNGIQWLWKEPEFDGLKPLYNLHLIASNPSAKIWICEGEWAADHLNAFLLKHNVQSTNIATTSGSSSSANKADWSSIAGYKSIIFPDNDESGQKYLNDVAMNLSALSSDFEVVDIESLNLPIQGDVVNWLEANPNAELAEFEAIPLEPKSSEFEPLFDIAEASVASFLKAPPPPRRYLLDKCLPLGKTGLVIGMGGVRKSLLMLQLQIAVATGQPLCDFWQIGEIGSSLGLFAEEETEELHRRFYYTTEAASVLMKNLLKKRVKIMSMSGLNNQLTHKSGSEAEFTVMLDRLIVTAKQIPDLKLIVIDPASRFRGGDENSSTDTTRFVEACEILAKETGATVLIVHHVNKASINSSEASQAAVRGSSAFTDGVRWQMNMNVMSTDEAKKYGVSKDCRKSFVSTEVTKNNYAPPQMTPVWLELTKPHGILNYVELTHTGENKKIETISKVIEKIKENASKGIEQSKSAFCKQYAGTDNIFKTGDKSLRGLIEKAIEDGLLVLSPPKCPIKNVSEVLVVAHQEPNLNGANEDFSSQL